MEAVKIKNALWLEEIGPNIKDFITNLNIPGITYESLFTYYQQSIQFGGEALEFWVVFDGHKPVSFAHFMVRGLPAVGKVYLDAIHSWVKDPEPVKLLLGEFYKFGVRSNALIYEADAIDERVFRLFRKYGKQYGINVEKTGRIHGIGKLLSQEERNEDLQ